MDSEIPIPKREIDKELLISVENTHQIAGRGTVITGTIETGKIKVKETSIIKYRYIII